MARKPRVEAVLDVAARLFARNGFASTGVDQIAEGADFTKGGLYYHIRAKEDLLLRICEHTITTILREAEPAVGRAATAATRIHAVIDAHLGFFHAHPDNLVVLNRDMGLLSPARRRKIVALERKYLDLVRGILRDGQRDGELGPGEPTVAAFLLLSMLNGLDAWYDSAGPTGPEALASQIAGLFLHGMAARERNHPAAE